MCSSGVPQGPILHQYSTFIPHVLHAVNNANVHLYADDTVLYVSGPSSFGWKGSPWQQLGPSWSRLWFMNTSKSVTVLQLKIKAKLCLLYRNCSFSISPKILDIKLDIFVNIIRCHENIFHCYADDTQLYVPKSASKSLFYRKSQIIQHKSSFNWFVSIKLEH